MVALSDIWLWVSIRQQSLKLMAGNSVVKQYAISTAKNGAGELNGSECTPRGRFRIKIKIGEECPINSVFQGRRLTGEIYQEQLAERFPTRDWILSRILWLDGLESGINRGGDRDTLRRFIYIHGTPDTEPMGTPLSHGCIRMRNADVVELFDQVRKGTIVRIDEH